MAKSLKGYGDDLDNFCTLGQGLTTAVIQTRHRPLLHKVGITSEGC